LISLVKQTACKSHRSTY